MWGTCKKRNVVWLYGCIFSTRDSREDPRGRGGDEEGRCGKDEKENARQKPVWNIPTAAVQDGVHARWFPVFSYSLSSSLGLIPDTVSRPLPSCLFLVRVTPMEYVTRRVIYTRRTHLERAMPDSTFAFAYTRAYVLECVRECVHITVSSTTERHMATPRSRISISIPSLYDPVDLPFPLSPARYAPLTFRTNTQPLLPSIAAVLDISDYR